ncbi:MAG TPA: RNA polymerase sigma factor [Rhizomicrobium sp.]|nr:RNA polymerase sigma factor [Rhizomicrobium sp.]
MGETFEFNRSGKPQTSGAAMAAADLKQWFVREVLPLEALLMHFLHQNWRNKTEIEDLRQDVYAQVLEAAKAGIPEKPKAFVITTARNLLIDRIRHNQVVPIDAVNDLDELNIAIDQPGPDRSVIARDVLRRLQAAIDLLPPRAREAVLLRRVEGLSRREIAERMGVSENTVSDHITAGMRALADIYLGEAAELRRTP